MPECAAKLARSLRLEQLLIVHELAMALGCRGLSLCELHDKEASSKRDVRLRFHGNQRVLADNLYRMYSFNSTSMTLGQENPLSYFRYRRRGNIADQGYRWEEPATGDRERKTRAGCERADG